MKFVKSTIALAAAALSSAFPAGNHTATNVTIANKDAGRPLPSCTRYQTFYHWEYDIWVGGVDDIPGKCGGLWDNLADVECDVHYKSYCGGIQETELLQWHFWTTDLCTNGYVTGAYKAALGDSYGDITCVQG